MTKNLEDAACLQLLSSNYFAHLAYISGEEPFIVPITYYHDVDEKCIISYSAIGHKIEAMRRHKHVSIQVEQVTTIQKWVSVQIHGTFEELEGSTAKKYLHKFAEGVQGIIKNMEGNKPKFIGDFSSRLQERKIPIVYRINIHDINGKTRNK